MQKNDLMLTAYHEAGHALMAKAAGWRVDRVTIEPVEVRAGDAALPAHLDVKARAGTRYVALGRTYISGLGATTTDELARMIRADRTLLPKWAVYSLGGAAAESILLGECGGGGLTQGQETDVREFGVCLAEMGLADRGADLYDLAVQVTRDHWPEITDLAEALLENGELDGQDVEELLDPAYN